MITYRKIEIDHDYAEAYSNIFCMSYNPENKIDQIVSEHLRYGAHFEKKTTTIY